MNHFHLPFLKTKKKQKKFCQSIFRTKIYQIQNEIN